MASSSVLSGSLAAQAQASLMESRQSAALEKLKSQQASGDDGKIDKSAQEFESMLLSTWLQQAEQSMATAPGGDEDDEDAAGRDQMMGLGVQALSASLAASGGIGIGKMIAHALHRAADKAQLPEESARGAASEVHGK